MLNKMFRGRKAASYIFFELLPSFLMGMLVFVLIILMFQVLRLTEFALIHGVDLKTIAEIIAYIVISMSPALFPMSLLFAVILTYGRLSADSEIVALKASGLHMGVLLAPALILGLIVGVISAQTTYHIAPWGNRQFEVLYTRMGNMKAAATIKPGTFSEGFFDLVVYTNDVDTETGTLKDVFIYDESRGEAPLTIIAKAGRIIPDPEAPGHRVLLRLSNGDIHRQASTHTKIKFDTYDIQLIDPIIETNREKSPQSLTIEEVRSSLQNPNLAKDDYLTLVTEYHKRSAIAVLCVVFAMIGVGLGTNTNRRSQKSGGMIICIGLIIAYWVLYLSFEGFARNGTIQPVLAIWTPNLIFGLIGFFTLRKNWN